MEKDIFKALADPARRQIVDLLAKAPLNINQINGHFTDISRQAVSKHLSVLEACEVIKIYQAGRERYGYLNKKAFEAIHEWLQPYLQRRGVHNDYEILLHPTENTPGAPLSYPVMLQAMLSKDAAFDGAFYIAVKTTGIFCKPSCHARPKPENVLFYTHREDALKNGYRSCKKCKP